MGPIRWPKAWYATCGTTPSVKSHIPPPELANRAIGSIDRAPAEKDGVSDLRDMIAAGIHTPLADEYRAEVLKLIGCRPSTQSVNPQTPGIDVHGRVIIMADKKHIPVVANWLAFNENAPCLGIMEFPFFTDAWLTGEITLGPYTFINTIAGGNRKAVNPAVILRYALHKEWDHPSFAKTDDSLYHGGSPQEELAALSSLILGIRLRSGRLVRSFEPGGDPLGRPQEIGDQAEPYFAVPRSYVIPHAAKRQEPGENSLEKLALIRCLIDMRPTREISLVRSARLYQDALWLAESEPEFSWLLLVSAIETVANEWRKDQGDCVDRLSFSKPELHEYLAGHSDGTLLRRIAEEFADSMGITKKFVDFCMQFKPEPPELRPAEWARYSWDDSSYQMAMRTIYGYRSRALHRGFLAELR